MFWNEFRDLLLAQNPSELITVAPQTEEWLDVHDADIVLEGPQASGGPVYQYSQRDGVEQVDGKWYTKYVLGPIFTGDTAVADEAEYKARKDSEQSKNVRDQRNSKLKDCDWTQVSDSTADKSAWATYRQALRDVPSQVGFPWEITWPTQP
jgi:hypothetical protein